MADTGRRGEAAPGHQVAGEKPARSGATMDPFPATVAAVLPQLVHAFDLEAGRFVYRSRDPRSLIGWSATDLEAMGPGAFGGVVHPDDLGRVVEHARRVAGAAVGEVFEVGLRVRAKDGQLRWILSRDTPLERDPVTGLVTRFLGVVEDLTMARRHEHTLARENAALRRQIASLERFQQHVEVLSELGELLQSARSEEELYQITVGYMRRLFPGRSGFFGALSASRDRLNVAFGWGIEHAEDWLVPEDCWAIRRGRTHSAGPDHEPVYCSHHPQGARLASACVPLQAQGEVLGVLSVWSTVPSDLADPSALVRLARSTGDVLELALTNLKLRVRLEAQAMRDPLTGLFNRRYMEESVRREVLRTRRQGTTIAMLVVDIDHFKKLNDDRGHDAGDEVLRHVSRALSSAIREADIACRYGGEEFALVLTECDEEGASRKAEELRLLVESLRIFYQGAELEPVTVSVGVATSAMDAAWSGRELFRAADVALYDAKRGGRNQVRCFDASMAPPVRRSLPPAARALHGDERPRSVVTLARALPSEPSEGVAQERASEEPAGADPASRVTRLAYPPRWVVESAE